jgi:hypothetical protein
MSDNETNEGRRRMTDPSCEHQWMVFSTALKEVCLMVSCARCRMFGVVEDPTAEEWKEAFHAPSSPYRWHDNSRVVTKGFPTAGGLANRG